MTESVKCSEFSAALDVLLDLPSGDRSPCPYCGSMRRVLLPMKQLMKTSPALWLALRAERHLGNWTI